MSPRKDSKTESHEKIRQTASRMIRREGFSSTSVHKVMQDSGLTVGGFYAHYDSREAMLREAFETAAAERRDYVRDMQAGMPPAWRAAHFVITYLTPGHVADKERGCMWAALLSDLPRAEQKTRELTSTWFKGSIDYFTGKGEPEPAKSSTVPNNSSTVPTEASDEALSPRETAIASMAIAFASLNLARMVTDENLRDEILAAGKKAAVLLSR